MGQDYYNILGLTRSAEDVDIKKALVHKYINKIVLFNLI